MDKEDQICVAQQMFDELLAAASSKASRKITDQERALLQVIAGKASGSIPSIHDLLGADQAKDHEQFAHSCVDIATIQIALKDPADEEFMAPLLGGISFLKHVLRCNYCLLSVADTLTIAGDFLVTDQIVAQVENLCAEAGVQLDPSATSVKEFLVLPKRN